MLRHLALVVSLLVTALSWSSGRAVAQDDLRQTLSTIERSLWEGWKNRDAEVFREHLAENAVTVGGGGVEAGKQAAIESIEGEDCQVEGYSFSDWALHRFGDDVAILTYRADQDAVCEGERLPETVIVSSTYVREGGSWMNAAYHETPVHQEH